MNKSTTIKPDQQYNPIHIASIIINILMSIVYVPVSLTSLILITFVWGIPIQNGLDIIKGIIGTILVLLIPASCILCISSSFLLRIKDKGKESILVQFIPIPIFIICVTILGMLIQFH